MNLVITGLGLTTSLGRGVAANWEALAAGRSGLRPVAAFADYPVQVGGEAPPRELAEDALALAPLDLGGEREPQRPLHQLPIEERGARFEAVGHGGHVDLGENVVG